MEDESAGGEFMSPEEYGRSLHGLGMSLLVTDVLERAHFLKALFGVEVRHANADFAALRHKNHDFMLHADRTYRDNPLIGLVSGVEGRGAGAEFHLYGVDPDAATEKARAHGAYILAEPRDKPHGLREAQILDPDGYVWVPSKSSAA